MTETTSHGDQQRRQALEGNLRRFILFRLFYSARFYYPVFTVLFLDYGLTLEQFSILNIVWAVSIVCAEVPSGALADIVGRKTLVVFAGAIMVVEMALILFAPTGSSPLLFLMFMGNRLCSGLSEAAASGADEALAYDSLKELGREEHWSALLEKNSVVVAVGFFTSMILGGLVYDPAIVNGALAWINPDWQLAGDMIIRLPILLTTISSVIVLFVALGMYDLDAESNTADSNSGSGISRWQLIAGAFQQILQAGRWTLNHRFVLFVIIAALALDSVGRQFVVLASEYWRAIEIPVPLFGVVGASLSLLAIVNARVSRILVHSCSPLTNFLILSAILLVGLVGISFAVPIWGVAFAVGAFAMMSMVQFMSSYYLNKEAGSAMRATILSFKGLALNLGLALASLLYTAWVAQLRVGNGGSMEATGDQQTVFVQSLVAFPFYYLLLFGLIVVLARWLIKQPDKFLRKPVAEHTDQAR